MKTARATSDGAAAPPLASSPNSNPPDPENQPDNLNGYELGQMIYSSLDPLDPRRVSLDLFELYCHEMIMTQDVGRRVFLINKMRVSFSQLVLFLLG